MANRRSFRILFIYLSGLLGLEDASSVTNIFRVTSLRLVFQISFSLFFCNWSDILVYCCITLLCLRSNLPKSIIQLSCFEAICYYTN